MPWLLNAIPFVRDECVLEGTSKCKQFPKAVSEGALTHCQSISAGISRRCITNLGTTTKGGRKTLNANAGDKSCEWSRFHEASFCLSEECHMQRSAQANVYLQICLPYRSKRRAAFGCA